MEGCAGVTDHVFGIDGLAGGVFSDDLGGMLEECLRYSIDGLVVDLRGGHQRHVTDIEAVEGLRLSPIGEGRDGLSCKKGKLSDEPVHRLGLKGNEVDGLGGTGLRDGGRRYGAAQEGRIGRSIREESHGAALCVIEDFDIVIAEAMRGQDGFDKVLKAGPSRSHHHASALEIGDRFDPGGIGRDKEGNIGGQGHDSPNGVFLFPFLLTPYREEGDGGVGQSEIDFHAV